MHRNAWFRILELFLAGIALDLIKHLITVRTLTGEFLSWHDVGVVALIVFPFAIFTEIIIDHPRFWHRVFRIRRGHKFDHLRLP